MKLAEDPYVPPTLAGLYAAWWNRVSLPGMHDIQRREMQRAFYSGMWAMLTEMRIIADNLSETDACDVWDGYRAEMQAFVNSVMKGDA